jgi:3-oxoacyl-[acyl-carrier-protein] synthase-3
VVACRSPGRASTINGRSGATNVGARILGISYHLPEKVVTNDDLGRENPDWKMDKIYEKAGIWSRHVAAEDETAGDLGFQAGRKLLERELVPAGQIDYLLYCTQSPDYLLPTTACILQDRLKLGTSAGSLDFNLGCSGYVYGLQLANSLILTGAARHVLLITADTYTKYIHPRDRTVRTLFGDGAAATLIGPPADGAGGIGDFVLGTDGSGAGDLIVPSGGSRLPRSADTARETMDEVGCVRSKNNLYMDGQAIFAFAVNVVPAVVSSLLAKTGHCVDDIDWYVYHQANKFMLENLAQCNNIPSEKMVYHLETVGNTVSSTIPLSVQAYVEAGRIKPGQRLILVGFGVGYSWGACAVTWG